MKLIATLVILTAACTIQNTFASKKVTASITVTGLTAAEINDKSTEILAAVATLLEVDASKVVSEGDASVSTVTTSAPTSVATTTSVPAPSPTTTASPVSPSPVSPSPVSPAPGRRMYDTDSVDWNPVEIPKGAVGRRLNAASFTFSVIVANDADATAMKTKLESSAFKTGLVTQLGTLYTGKTISIVVSTPIVDDYTPAADELSTGYKAGSRHIVYAFLAIFVFVFL